MPSAVRHYHDGRGVKRVFLAGDVRERGATCRRCLPLVEHVCAIRGSAGGQGGESRLTARQDGRICRLLREGNTRASRYQVNGHIRAREQRRVVDCGPRGVGIAVLLHGELIPTGPIETLMYREQVIALARVEMDECLARIPGSPAPGHTFPVYQSERSPFEAGRALRCVPSACICPAVAVRDRNLVSRICIRAEKHLIPVSAGSMEHIIAGRGGDEEGLQGVPIENSVGALLCAGIGDGIPTGTVGRVFKPGHDIRAVGVIRILGIVVEVVDTPLRARDDILLMDHEPAAGNR